MSDVLIRRIYNCVDDLKIEFPYLSNYFDEMQYFVMSANNNINWELVPAAELDGNNNCFINPLLVDASDNELKFELLHECLHSVRNDINFMKNILKTSNQPNMHKALNWLCDLRINDWIYDNTPYRNFKGVSNRDGDAIFIPVTFDYFASKIGCSKENLSKISDEELLTLFLKFV